jgi:hypothetical protein
MKKFFLLILLAAGLSFESKAAPGDTTWVQAHSGVWLDWYNNFDSTVTFPDGSKSYRRIYMYFTLGKYVCPGNPQYCSDWDYTVQTLLMTPGGDTVELGRLITPYANSPRMGASWKGVYVFDVTDYYPILKNSGTVRVHYSGYSGGFTADVKFAFIEGTPARNVLGINRIWKGSYNYGHGSVAINDALGNVSLTAPANTVSAEAKFTITGHGGDAGGCAEFCPNTYTMNLNNAQLVNQNFWRANCGSNNYYPQNGTWVYDRAGWCPGDKVLPYSHALTGVTGGNNFSLNVTFPPYTSTPSSSGSTASYIIESNVVYYNAFNHTLDASLDDILAPSNNEAYFRMNPLVGKPVIKVKNTGSTPITSLKIEYGVSATWKPTYTWTGTINPLQEQEISLPEPWGLRIATGNNNTFTATILEVNGQADQDATNNQLSSLFNAAPVYDVKFRIVLRTNGSVANGVSETSWKIYDYNENVVAQRINNTVNTTYDDTLTLGPAIYRLEVTDAGCDGVNWWVYPYYPTNPGIGYVQVRKMGGVGLPVKGYYNGDFGCGFTQYFRTDWPTTVENVTTANMGIKAYPNPAQDRVTVELSGVQQPGGDLQLIDALGRVVLREPCTGTIQELNIASLSSGIYTLVFSDGKGRLQTRLSISK